MKVEQWILEKLTPYAGNPRKNDGAVAAVAKSIERYGFRQPIVVDRDGVIVVGHTRFKAAKKLGLKQVPVHVAEDLTESKAREYRIADNSTNEIAEWDTKMLAAELGEMPEFNAAEFGVDFAALNIGNESSDADAEPQIDKAEELRAKWGVEPGQLWQLGDHRLMCGDSSIIEHAQTVMGGGLTDMVLTDPPYGVAYVGKTKDALTVENDDVDEATLEKMCQQWFDVADAVSRDGAYWIATVPPGPLHGVFFNDWKRRGYLRQVLVWNKDSMVMGHSEYHYKHESILFGWKPGDRLRNADRTKTTVWDFARPKASREHPTMKPVAMWAYAINNHTRVGDTLYEPFSGSGTTIIACEQLGRKCRAIEISPAYVAVALQRWADATGKTPHLIA